MTVRELIEILSQEDQDFIVKIKHPSEHKEDISELSTNHSVETVTIYTT